MATEIDDVLELVATALHDLKNGMAPVVGFAQLLELDADSLSEDHRQFVEGIIAGSDRVLTMVEDLRARVRMMAGPVQPPEPVAPAVPNPSTSTS